MGFVTKETEYFKYSNEPNINLYGNFTKIVDEVAYDFSSANYITIPSFDANQVTEAQIAFSTSQDVDSYQGLFFAGVYDDSSTFVIQGGEVKLNNKNSGSHRSTISMGLPVKPNTSYVFKFTQSGSTITPFLSENGGDFVQGSTVSRSRTLRNFIGYGLDNDSTNHPFYGTIDLKNTYIKLNNELWWTNYKNLGATGGYLRYDDTQSHIGGFNSSNYFTIPFDDKGNNTFFSPGNNKWELELEIRTGGDVSTSQYIFGSTNASGYNGYLMGFVGSKLTAWISSTGNGWDIAGEVKGVTTLETETYYTIRMGWNGKEYYADMSKNFGEFVREFTVANTAHIYPSYFQAGASWDRSLPFYGFIRLSKSKITVNDKIVWSGKKTYQVNLGGEDVYKDWTQPVFSSNTYTSADGVTYNLSASHESTPAWYAFNNNRTTNGDCWWTNHGVTSESNPCWIQLKTSRKLKLTKITVRNEHDTPENFKKALIQVSDTGDSWETVKVFEGVNSGGYDVSTNIPVDKGYYYYRLYFTESFGAGGVSIQTIDFYGKQEVPLSKDYDFTRNKINNHEAFATFNNNSVIERDNYQIVGSFARLDKGVARGFVNGTYLQIPEQFNPGDKDWTIVLKIRTGDLSVAQDFGGIPGVSVSYYVDTAGNVQFNIGNGSSFNIQPYFGKAEAYKTYWLKAEYVSGEYRTYMSFDGVEYLHNQTITSTQLVRPGFINLGDYEVSGTEYFHGEIDLNESYIDIAGERWWSGDRYNKIGRWIEDGSKINGFTTGDYLSVSKEVPEIKKYESVLYFTTPSNFNILDYSTLWSCNVDFYGFQVFVSSTGEYTFDGYGIGSDWNVRIEPVCQLKTSTKYKEHITWDGNLITVKISEVGTDVEYIGTVESPVFTLTNPFWIGKTGGWSAGKYWTGSVDLSQSYININNEPWWSYKEYIGTAQGSINWDTVFDSSTAGTYDVEIPEDCIARVTCVGGGGAAAILGRYDDRGYGWSGGSGGAFEGDFLLPAGTYSVTVGSANNNTKPQGGNSNTINPDDTTTHDSYITGIVRVGGGGAGTTNGVGAAGLKATLDTSALKIKLNANGNAGAYGAGGKGSGANATMQGGASVYQGYGQGQGCSVSEYANRRYWIDGTNGYVKILTTSITEYNSSKTFLNMVVPAKINFQTIPESKMSLRYSMGHEEANTLFTVRNSFVSIDAAKTGWNRYHKDLIVRGSEDFNVVLDRTLFESSTAGTYTINIEEDGYLEMQFVGGGGGGATSSWSSGYGSGSSGGSGGYSRYYNIRVTPGEYTVTVGAGGGRALTYEWGDVWGGTGGDSFFELDGVRYYAGGGIGGHAWGAGGYEVAPGGWGNVKNGNSGNVVVGNNQSNYDTPSVYGGYGVGGAGPATNPGGGLTGWSHNGGSGYAKIVFRLAEV